MFNKELWMQLGIYGMAGFQLALTVISGLFVGYFIDKYFNLSPVFTVICIFAASIGGFYNLFRILKWYDRRENNK